MRVVYERCCGLDIHKKTVVACLVTPGDGGDGGVPRKEVRTFGTMTEDLLRLGDWLTDAGCTHAAMEATGVLWKPLFNPLEGSLTLLLVNAQHAKQVPGRKTDVKDCEWLADLLRHGVLRGSFVPERPQRELRELTRYRTALVRERTAEVNRISNHAVNRTDPQPGEWAAVLGAGPIGLGVMRISKLRGARVLVTDVVDYRLELARRLGADAVVSARRDDPIAAARDRSGGKGFDRVVECVGGDQDETLGQAVAMVKPRGVAVAVGSLARDRATIPVVNFKFSEKELRGSQGAPEGYGPALDLVASGQVDVRPVITHRLPLEAAEHGLQLMDRKAEGVVKLVIQP